LRNTLNKSLLFSLTAVFLWSTVATAFKLSLEYLSFPQLLFYASLTSAIIFLILSSWRTEKMTVDIVKSAFSFKSSLLGFINPFLYYIILLKAYTLLPAQEAQPLNFTWPIVVSIFASIFLKQRLAATTFFGLLISFSGVFVIATRGNIFSLQFNNLLGVSLAVGSSLVWAAYWTLNLSDKRSSYVKLFGSFFWGSVFTAVYILFFDSFEVQSIFFITGAVYIGFFEMGFTFYFWLRGLELSNDKAKTSTLAYISPFVSMLFIAFILGEEIYLSSLAGLFLIISGIVFQHVFTRPKS